MNLYNWLNSLFLHIPSVKSEKVEDFLMALQLKTIYRIGLMEEKEKERGGRERRRRKREEEGKEEDNFFIQGTGKVKHLQSTWHLSLIKSFQK